MLSDRQQSYSPETSSCATTENKRFSLTYIWHDGFVLRIPSVGTVIFDFWRDPREKRITEPEWVTELKKSHERVWILVSHHHKDHFVRKIFEWSENWPEVHYIISRDVEKMARHMLRTNSLWNGVRVPEAQVTVLRPGETWGDGALTVNAFGSTDIGNSYVVEGGGLKAFHAGDLNAWIWKDESTPKEVETKKFTDILSVIAERFPKLDIAMMPVDSRIGTDYFTGARMLVRKIDVGLFVPMHFGLGDVNDQPRYQSDALRFDLYANPERGSYVALTSPGASFIRN